MNQRSVSYPTPRPLLVRGHGYGFRCTCHVSLQRCHDMASPSLHGVPRDGSPTSAILWDAPTPRRPSRPIRFLHEPIPSCRPWFAPLGRGRPTGGQGVVGSGLPIPIDDGNVGVSQVPWKPWWSLSVLFDPGITPARKFRILPYSPPVTSGGWGGTDYLLSSSDGSSWNSHFEDPQFSLTATAVPEPDSFLLMGLSGVLFLVRPRWRARPQAR